VKILVVEDEARLAAALARGLEAEGFAVDIAPDGEDGLWRAKEFSYDAIVLDIMLPRLNGYQVCAQLREAGVWTPILMLTAKDGDLDEAEALDTGADDYLTKPFSYVVLVAHLRALLRRGTPDRCSSLVAGDLRLDIASRSCWRGETEIPLTTREFQILEYLLHNVGQVVTKTGIIDHVWDAAYDGDFNVVEVHISSLRKKIDTAFGRRSIQTVRGVGYRLLANGG
jgi:two-component system, OmpR family, response regulator